MDVELAMITEFKKIIRDQPEPPFLGWKPVVYGKLNRTVPAVHNCKQTGKMVSRKTIEI